MYIYICIYIYIYIYIYICIYTYICMYVGDNRRFRELWCALQAARFRRSLERITGIEEGDLIPGMKRRGPFAPPRFRGGSRRSWSYVCQTPGVYGVMLRRWMGLSFSFFLSLSPSLSLSLSLSHTHTHTHTHTHLSLTHTLTYKHWYSEVVDVQAAGVPRAAGAGAQRVIWGLSLFPCKGRDQLPTLGVFPGQ